MSWANKKLTIFIISVIFGISLFIYFGIVKARTAKAEEQHTSEVHSNKTEHEHSSEADEVDDDVHAHEEDKNEKHSDEHGDEAKLIKLSAEQKKSIKLELATAGPGAVVSWCSFPGEIVPNPDAVTHVTPQAAGIVRETTKTIGDRVKSGEVLAWIESDELAEAKLAYYAKQIEVGCCMIKLPRAKEIFENTAKLLEQLKRDAGQGDVEKLDNLEMGEYRGRLLTAYTEYIAARDIYVRKKHLHEKKFVSDQEIFEVETNLKRAQANFDMAVDTARYDSLTAYNEAIQQRMVAEFEAVAAEKRLRLSGADNETVEKLRALVPQITSIKPCLCSDPNCQEGKLPAVADQLAKDKRFAFYPLRAISDGFVFEKHLSLGEKVTDEVSAFTIMNDTVVWVRFNISQKDASLVRLGQEAHIYADNIKLETGKISYISPVIDGETRTIPARIVMQNKDSMLRPGFFVKVTVNVGGQDADVVIPKSAVQQIDEKTVVFIEEGEGFEPLPVQLGAEDKENVIITNGLRPGQRFVTQGSFELKSKIVTGALGSHAGHGH